MPNDETNPSLDSRAAGSSEVHVLATLHMKPDHTAAYLEEMKPIAAHLEEQFHWKLLGSFADPADATIVRNLWLVPNAASLQRDQAALSKHEPYTRLAQHVEQETLTLLSGLPAAPPPGKPPVFDDDLLVAADDGVIYYVSESTWKEHPVSDKESLALKREFINKGVMVADIPTNPNVGLVCYLLNLASLRPSGTK